MKDGEEWLLRPSGEGMCKYESLIDCTLDLGDVARMNAFLDVKAENDNRRNKANKEG